MDKFIVELDSIRLGLKKLETQLVNILEARDELYEKTMSLRSKAQNIEGLIAAYDKAIK